MPSKRAERTITISGKNGYVQLLPEEKKALRIEVYFTATNVGKTNYYSYEWYKERTLYGRVKIARGEYTTKEKLIQYQNELLYSEEATLFEIVKRLQCQNQKQYEVNKFVVESLISIATQNNVVLSILLGTTAFTQIPPQPIEVPGLQIDGLYYNMFPGCAGNLVLQTWYDNDVCKDVNNTDLTKDNRGDAPEPASAGRPPSGTDADVPAPTFPADGTYKDPTPNSDVPTDTLENPLPTTGISCSLYTLRFSEQGNSTGGALVFGNLTIVGEYTSLINRSQNPLIVDKGVYHGIGCTNLPGYPRWQQIQGGNAGTASSPASEIKIVSITPQ